MPEKSSAETVQQKIYSDFDSFLKVVIYEYYKRSGRIHKGNFIALLIASGEMGSMAMDSVKTGSGLKKIIFGAASVVALKIGLRYALSGPLGILLAGATAASLVAYFVRNRGEITQKIGTYRELVQKTKQNYAKLQSDYRDARFSQQQRDLMIDGLLQRMLQDLDQAA